MNVDTNEVVDPLLNSAPEKQDEFEVPTDFFIKEEYVCSEQDVIQQGDDKFTCDLCPFSCKLKKIMSDHTEAEHLINVNGNSSLAKSIDR